MSESKNLFVESLLKAKPKFGAVLKNKTNLFHKNKYADLDSVNAAVDAPLMEHGLLFVHLIVQKEAGSFLVSKLLHVSGEFNPDIQQSSYPLPDILDPQKLGSALTYGRRYNICNLLGLVADADDDGNSSTKITNPQVQALRSLVNENGWSAEEASSLIQKKGYNKSTELDLTSYQEICAVIKANPKKKSATKQTDPPPVTTAA